MVAFIMPYRCIRNHVPYSFVLLCRMLDPLVQLLSERLRNTKQYPIRLGGHVGDSVVVNRWQTVTAGSYVILDLTETNIWLNVTDVLKARGLRRAATVSQ